MMSVELMAPDWRGRGFIRRGMGRIPFQDRSCNLVVTLRKTYFGHEIRWFALWRSFDERQVVPVLVFSQDVLTTTPGSNFTYQSNVTFDNSSNSAELIGAGAKGAIGAGTTSSGAGGGGGAFTGMRTNGANAGFQFVTPGTTTAVCRVGLAGATNGAAGGDTWVNDTVFPSTGTNKLGAKGGAALASGTTTTGGAGGLASAAYTSGFTNPVTFNGGTGGAAGANNASAGAGGGAAGPRGAGVTPGTGPTAGGAANGGFGAAGGAAGAPGLIGGTGQEWSQLVGCGAGGGSANASAATGGAGGNYGGGSSGGARSTGVSGAPANGVIVFSWPLIIAKGLLSPSAIQPILAM